jgi:hypothetical protein
MAAHAAGTALPHAAAMHAAGPHSIRCRPLGWMSLGSTASRLRSAHHRAGYRWTRGGKPAVARAANSMPPTPLRQLDAEPEAVMMRAPTPPPAGYTRRRRPLGGSFSATV